MAKLLKKEIQFARHYVEDAMEEDEPTRIRNSLMKAGYDEKFAYKHCGTFLSDPDIFAEVTRLERGGEALEDIRKSDVLTKYWMIAKANITDYYEQLEGEDDHGLVDDVISKHLNKLTPDQKYAIRALTISRSGKGSKGRTQVTFQLESKLEALKAIREIEGMDKPKKIEAKTQNETYNLNAHGTSGDLANTIMEFIGRAEGSKRPKKTKKATPPRLAADTEEGPAPVFREPPS